MSSELRELLRRTDPVATRKSAADPERIRVARQRVIEAAHGASRPFWNWSWGVVTATVIAVAVSVSVGVPPRKPKINPSASSESRVSEIRYLTPGGTTLIWVLHDREDDEVISVNRDLTK